MDDKYLLLSFCNNLTPSLYPLLLVKIPGNFVEKDIRFAPISYGFGMGTNHATGLCKGAGYLFSICLQGLTVLNERDLTPISFQALPIIHDPHSLAFHKNHLYVVSTGTDEVYRYEMEGAHLHNPQMIWRTGDSDQHVNAIVEMEGEFIVSAKGSKSGANFINSRSGYIHNISRDMRIRDGIFLPHSLTYRNKQLYYCEAGSGRFYSMDGLSGKVDGYARGMAWLSDDVVCVGSSIGDLDPYNHQGVSKKFGKCQLTFFNVLSRTILSQIDLAWFGEQIYDIVVLDDFKEPTGKPFWLEGKGTQIDRDHSSGDLAPLPVEADAEHNKPSRKRGLLFHKASKILPWIKHR